MKLIEQIQATYGKRVLLDTPLSTVRHNTEYTETGIGIVCKFSLTVSTQTILTQELTKHTKEFHDARKEAASYITRELYGEIADRLVEISYKDYETNKTGNSDVRQMINQLINELKI